MEKRLYKMQLMLTDSELQEIDDWRFENRAESRSAAVRQLIRAGLASLNQNRAKTDETASEHEPQPSSR